MWVASDRPCGHSFGWEAPVTVHLGRGFLLKCAGPWSQGLVLHAGVLRCTVVMGFPSPSLFPQKEPRSPDGPRLAGLLFSGTSKASSSTLLRHHWTTLYGRPAPGLSPATAPFSAAASLL